MRITILTILLALLLPVVFLIALGALQFVEYKEFPHVCAMTVDRSSFEAVPPEEAVGTKRSFPSHYEVFHVTDKRRNSGEKESILTKEKLQHQQQQHHDLVFFVHGNSGNAGEARWYLSELMKVLLAGKEQEDDMESDNTRTSMFSFGFGEESNIHSGIVLERQVQFVAAVVAERWRKLVVDARMTRRVAPRCVWFIGHSMGGFVVRRASALLHKQQRQRRFAFRRGGGGRQNKEDGDGDRPAEDALQDDGEINICGAVVLASPQHRLPVHLNADVGELVEDQPPPHRYHQNHYQKELETAEENEEEEEDRSGPAGGLRPPITVLISVTGGAADIEVFEPLARLQPQRRALINRDSVVQVQVSAVSLAGLSTSHHGITYCHQLVRPVVRSLVYLMAQQSVVSGILAFSSPSSSPQEPERIRRVLEEELLSPGLLQVQSGGAGADVNPRSHERAHSSSDHRPLAHEVKSTVTRTPLVFESLLAAAFSPRTMLILTGASKFRFGGKLDDDSKVHSSDGDEILLQQQGLNFGLPVPWVTARHDDFTVSNGCDPAGTNPISHLRLLSSAYNFRSKIDERRVLVNFYRLHVSSSVQRRMMFPCEENYQDQEDEGTQQQQQQQKQQRQNQPHREEENFDNFMRRSVVVADSRSRIFWSQKKVSLGGSAFWITARLRQTWRKEAQGLYPVIAARCGNRAGYLLNLRDKVAEQEQSENGGGAQCWMWIPAFTGGTLLFPTMGSSSSSSRHKSSTSTSSSKSQLHASADCELMLLSAEPLCSDASSSSSASSACWHLSVATAPLPFRMIHASRYCESSYELAFAGSGLFVSLLVAGGALVVYFFSHRQKVLGSVVVAIPVAFDGGGGGGSGKKDAAVSSVPWAFLQNPLLFAHSLHLGVSSSNNANGNSSALPIAATLIIALAGTFLWIFIALLRLSFYSCDLTALALASCLTFCLAVALAVAAIVAISIVRLLVDRAVFSWPSLLSASSSSSSSSTATTSAGLRNNYVSIFRRALPVFVCVFLSFTVAPLAPLFAAGFAVWYARGSLCIRASTATPRTARAIVVQKEDLPSFPVDVAAAAAAATATATAGGKNSSVIELPSGGSVPMDDPLWSSSSSDDDDKNNNKNDNTLRNQYRIRDEELLEMEEHEKRIAEGNNCNRKNEEHDTDGAGTDSKPTKRKQQQQHHQTQKNSYSHHHHHHRRHLRPVAATAAAAHDDSETTRRNHQNFEAGPIFPPEEQQKNLPLMTVLQQQQFLLTEAVHLWWWTVSLASCSALTTVFTLRNMVVTKSVSSQVFTHDLSSSILAGLNCLPLFALLRMRYPQPVNSGSAADNHLGDWSSMRLSGFVVFIVLLFANEFFHTLLPVAVDPRSVPTLRIIIVVSLVLGGGVRMVVRKIFTY